MFNNIQSYPSYFQSSSVDGDPIALIVAFAATSFCILTPVARPDQNGFEVSVNEVDSLDGVKSQVGGRIVPLDVASYNETLYEKWGYDGSDRYKAVEGGVQNADDEKTDTTAAAQPDPNTNADNIREQQSGSDGVDGQRNGENVASTAVDGSGTTSGETAPTEPASDAGANPDDNVPADPGVDGDGSAGAPGDEQGLSEEAKAAHAEQAAKDRDEAEHIADQEGVKTVDGSAEDKAQSAA